MPIALRQKTSAPGVPVYRSFEKHTFIRNERPAFRLVPTTIFDGRGPASLGGFYLLFSFAKGVILYNRIKQDFCQTNNWPQARYKAENSLIKLHVIAESDGMRVQQVSK